jgi:cytochrome P450 family 307 subfamily A
MVLTATLVLLAVCVVLLALLMMLTDGHAKKPEGSRPPGPKPWPVIGSLHLLGQYKSPFEALTNLGKIYGEIYSITLGTTPCVVVNTFSLIKEVLITKGSHFGDRPNFIRFHKLFGGDRNNCKFHALHFCKQLSGHVYA